MKRLSRLALAAALMLALAVPVSAQVSDGVVKIGVLNDMSGVYSDLCGPGSVEAVKMAVEDFGGKVLGKPIEVVSADHQNKADIGANVANKWIDVDKVDVIVDLPNTAVCLAVQKICQDKNRINLISTGASVILTNKNCSPTGFHWTYDNYALGKGTGTAMVKEGGDTWFFLTADYAFGHDLEKSTAEAVTKSGGTVKGSVRHPFPCNDFSSFLLQAQASKAKVIGLANAGGDTINAVKQAAEFGIVQAGQRLAGLLVFISDIHSLGLKTAQGLVVTTGFYWDQNDETRAWSKKWSARMNGRMPTMAQAGCYSATMHYLKAVQAAGSDEAKAVAKKMREIPVNDFFAKNGKVREDGRMVHDMLLAQVKKPEDSKYAWDYYKILRVIPGDEAYKPISETECPYLLEKK
ncbi:MAG: ABC transporter substrate-binding protein [Desulfarculus sp.]|nr:ABC transporter substrate-binding protein [Desulfarculus sp.]